MSIPAFAVSIAHQSTDVGSKEGKEKEASGIERCLNYQNVLSAENLHTNSLNRPLSIFKSVWASTTQIAKPKTHLIVLCECLAQLLISLLEEPPEPQEEEDGEATHMAPYWDEALGHFTTLLTDVSVFAQTRSSYNFVRTIFLLENTTRLIGAYFERWQTAVDLFQLSEKIDTENLWKNNILKAHREDALRISSGLNELATRQDLLRKMLALNENSPHALMAAFQQRINNNIAKASEKAFYELGLRYLVNSTGKEPRMYPWTITSFDVEIKGQIGSGGFGIVCEGKWKDIRVAVKILHTENHVAPQIETIRREIETWSNLRHANIIEFLGANILDDKPFFVMPLLVNGNAKDYVRNNPNFPRIHIIHHVALGLSYLHAQLIVHGDLKAANVLLDDNLNAVLCDFGLSRLKSDVNTRTADSSPVFMGSQNWMAPELFRGGSLRFSCDIYSFGMTVYEIYTSEIPLGTVPTMEALRRLVVDEHVRPEQPEAHEAPQLTKKIWTLAKQCWHKDPESRPTAAAVCKILDKVDDAVIPQPTIMPEKSAELYHVKQKNVGAHLRGVSEPTEGPQRPVTRRPSFFERLIRRRTASEPSSDTIPPVPRTIASRKAYAPQNTIPEEEEKILPRSKSFFWIRLSLKENTPSDISELPPLIFATPSSRCMSLDHGKIITVISLSEGGRYLAVGLEVNHVEIWDLNTGRPHRPSQVLSNGRPILQPSEINITRMHFEPIISLDFRDTVSGRFMVAATASEIRVRECQDMRRTKAKEREVNRPEAADILAVRFEGGQYCDRVAIIDVAHALKVRPKFEEVVKPQTKAKPILRLMGITEADRTCFLWPRKGDYIFVGIKGGDILVYNSSNGQEAFKALTYGEVPGGRTTSGTGRNRFNAWGKVDIQDGVGQPLRVDEEAPQGPAECRFFAYHHEAKKLAVCYSSGEIRIWDLQPRHYQVLRRPQKVLEIDTFLFPVAFSPLPKESLVVYPSLIADQTLVFQDFNTGQLLGEAHLPEAPWNRICEIVISPDKKRKVIVAFEKYTSIKVWCWD
ncbi:hypothetical protein CPB83DRAFT_848994 [Crepidotus variabilis]|uniref:Protein kinase domain-containing protein n=1 Tax=Crepidotus variabilis TaxID=179855 RepID=A0A9P6EM34_9AGAR|nr:hypothetical protein CPB83DRAFT_848994 [Crepidotus variabilis]